MTEDSPDTTTDSSLTPEQRADAIMDAFTAAKGGKRREGQYQMARQVARCLVDKTPLLIEGGTGIGKALDVDTPIPTPTGFVRMGDLVEGDTVFDELGATCRVVHAFAVRQERPCYEVTFSDGSTIVADSEHLWQVSPRAARARPGEWEDTVTLTTDELRKNLACKDGRKNYSIPAADSLQTTGTDTPVPAHGFGMWLAGISDRFTANGVVQAEDLPENAPGFILTGSDTSTRARITPDDTTRSLDVVASIKPAEKRIPESYLFAQESVRRELLAGLLDARGFVVNYKKHRINQVQLTTTQGDFARDVQSLMCSLGFRPTCRQRTNRDGKPVTWVVSFSPHEQVFHSPRKVRNLGLPAGVPPQSTDATPKPILTRTITDITHVDSRPVRCIQVDSPSHLYLAGTQMIPTHNSLAYVAGVMASRKQTVIAPHTIALQRQMKADLEFAASPEVSNPLIEQGVIEAPITSADLQGRSNYVCLAKINAPQHDEQQELEMGDQPERSASDSGLASEVRSVYEWSRDSETGNRSDLPFPVSRKAWDAVSVSTDDCSKKSCRFNKDETCFADRARKNAMEADVIVTNQSMYAMGIKYPMLFPETVGAWVVDEAHEFAGVLAEHFGANVSVRRIENAIKKGDGLTSRDGSRAKDGKPENPASAAQTTATAALTLLVQRTPLPQGQKQDRSLPERKEVRDALSSLAHALEVLAETISLHAPQDDEDEKSALETRLSPIKNLVEEIAVLLEGTTDTRVVWVEESHDQPVFRAAQFDVSGLLAEHVWNHGSVVFTSATLTVNGSYDIPALEYGLRGDDGQDAFNWRGERVLSPFDYGTQGLLWLPPDMPEPSTQPDKAQTYVDAVADVAATVAKAANGRTLMLCTSRGAVRAISERLKLALPDNAVLVQEQGEAAGPLAAEFARDPHSVLVATRTFWAGVSTEGPACAAVILDKIPFPSPADPIIAAQTEKANRRKPGSGFKAVTLARASITLTQGVGRLIRTVTDEGVVVVCDPRVNPASTFKKFYGPLLFRGVPRFAFTRDKEEVVARLRDIDARARDDENCSEVDTTADDIELDESA